MPETDIWRFLMILFMTLGVISVMGALLGHTGIHQTGFPVMTEYSSPIFAFIGAGISLIILGKALGGKWTTSEVMYIMIVGFVVILLYMTVPNYLPPSFEVLGWDYTPILP